MSQQGDRKGTPLPNLRMVDRAWVGAISIGVNLRQMMGLFITRMRNKSPVLLVRIANCSRCKSATILKLTPMGAIPIGANFSQTPPPPRATARVAPTKPRMGVRSRAWVGAMKPRQMRRDSGGQELLEQKGLLLVRLASPSRS